MRRERKDITGALTWYSKPKVQKSLKNRFPIPISLYSLVLPINIPDTVAPTRPHIINNEPHNPAAFYNSNNNKTPDHTHLH